VTRPVRAALALGAGAGLLSGLALPARAGLLGEENVTLVQILAEITGAHSELEAVSDWAAVTATTTRDVLDLYAEVNAGIAELKGYSTDEFLDDLGEDLYQQYPGLGELRYASRDLDRWDQTRSRSPFTAYEAISAVAADLSAPLRDDVEAGRVDIDRTLVLRREAAGGFAAAHTAEDATRTFDELSRELHELAEDASPGQAAQISARAQLAIMAQQSHMIRLLSRMVRLDGVDKAIAVGERIDAMNAAHARREQTQEIFLEAIDPPRMMRYDAAW
jgi:hypothetical protein